MHFWLYAYLHSETAILNWVPSREFFFSKIDFFWSECLEHIHIDQSSNKKFQEKKSHVNNFTVKRLILSIKYYASVSWSSIVCCISSGVRRSMANFFFPDVAGELSPFSSCCSSFFTRFEYSWNDAASAYVNFLAKALQNGKKDRKEWSIGCFFYHSIWLIYRLSQTKACTSNGFGSLILQFSLTTIIAKTRV